MVFVRIVDVNSDNINKICRICLLQESRLVPLSTSIIKFKGEDESLVDGTISDVLMKITSKSVQIVENLPTHICLKCVDLVKSAYVFVLKFEESSEILRKYLESVIKSDIEGTCLNEEIDDIDSESKYQFDDDQTSINSEKDIGIQEFKKSKTALPNAEEIEEFSPKIVSLLHPCPICMVEFTALNLRHHAYSHRALRKYLMINKPKPNIKFYATPRCKPSVFNQAQSVHRCPYCNDSFPIQQFRIHVDNHKQLDEFKCDKCDRVFRKINHLNTHRLKHLKEYPYKCSHCGKGFVIKTNYNCHMLTHTSSELPHKCSYCFRTFSNPEHLHRHQIIHTENVSYSVKYKVCRCKYCLKTFKDKSNLTKHICIPVGQISNRTKYHCKYCRKTFKKTSKLYNHIRKIHQLQNSKMLCSVCGSYVSNINVHMIRHTGEKPYQCSQCDKRFGSRPQLKQHLLVHSGLKPFVCTVCAKAFNNSYNLQVHERIHKGNKCHICPICDKGFLEKSYLKKHINVHTNIVTNLKNNL